MKTSKHDTVPLVADSTALVPTAVASSLTRLSEQELLDLVAAGRVRAERIGGRLFLSLDDAEQAARQGGGR